MFGDFMLVLQDLVPEAIPSQKFHMNLNPIVSGYRNTGIWNVSCANRCGYVICKPAHQ